MIVGGNGADGLFGGRGKDACLDARDRERGNDLIDGGPGGDGFAADPDDVVRSAVAGTACPTGTPPP